jgi:uncharacterized membrane protein
MRAHLLWAIGLAGCAGAAPSIELVGERTSYEGIVTHAHGTVARVGESCAVSVQRTSHAAYNCRVTIRCGEELIYGLADSGYNECRGGSEADFVGAEDRYPTRADGDPRMMLDLTNGRAIVADDNPDLRLLISLRRENGSAIHGARPDAGAVDAGTVDGGAEPGDAGPHAQPG